jgi:hypothetical protein
MNTLVAYLSIAGVGSHFLVVVLIAALTTACVYVVIALLCNRTAAIISLPLINLIPLYWNNIFSFTSDSLAAAGYLLLVSALLLSRCDADRIERSLISTLAIVGSALFAGSRHNGMMAAVAFLCLVTVFRRHMALRASVLGSASAGILVAAVLNGFPGPQHRQLTGMMMAWELAGVSRFVNDEAVERILAEMGDAEAARRLFDPSLFDSVVIGRPPQSPPPLDVTTVGSIGKIVETYFTTMVRHPIAFLRNKIEIWGAVWGLDTIHIKTIGTWDLPLARVDAGSIDLNLRPFLGWASDIATSALMKVGKLWFLWFLFSPAVFLVCTCLVLRTSWERDEALLFLGAFMYQATFMVLAPGFHFRYGWLFVLVSTLLMLVGGWKLLRRPYRAWREPCMQGGCIARWRISKPRNGGQSLAKVLDSPPADA